VKKKVRDVIELVLGSEEWEDSMCEQWVDRICCLCIDELHAAKKPFKYVVTCSLMQRTGAAVHSSRSAYWDGVSDGSVTVMWPKRNAADATNKTIICMVTVFAVAFYVN
jgi:dynein light chain Tctex-type 1